MDKGPLKVAWRVECHSYLARIPGRVITRYQFSSLFRKAWFKSMSVVNIAAGFRVTGIYPVVLSPIKEKADSLTKETGLSFIPLWPETSFSCPELP
jgi:hypothetical protein